MLAVEIKVKEIFVMNDNDKMGGLVTVRYKAMKDADGIL